MRRTGEWMISPVITLWRFYRLPIRVPVELLESSTESFIGKKLKSIALLERS